MQVIHPYLCTMCVYVCVCVCHCVPMTQDSLLYALTPVRVQCCSWCTCVQSVCVQESTALFIATLFHDILVKINCI